MHSNRCRLWVKIHDSYEDEADPLTKVALDTIQASGKVLQSEEDKTSGRTEDTSRLRTFAEAFLDEVTVLPGYDDDDGGHRVKRRVKRAIRAKFPEPKASSPAEILSYKEPLRRIRLCSPHWPDVSVPGSLCRADDKLKTQ